MNDAHIVPAGDPKQCAKDLSDEWQDDFGVLVAAVVVVVIVLVVAVVVALWW